MLSGGPYRQTATLWIHDEAFSKDEFLFNSWAFPDSGISPGDIIEIASVDYNSLHPSEIGSRKLLNESIIENDGNANLGLHPKFSSRTQSRCLFVVKPMPQEIRQRHPKLEISVTRSVANIFGFKNGCHVIISQVDRSQCSASHVDISFRDQYLVRADMWRLVTSELVNKTIYKGQKILFMGSVRATVKNIFIGGKKALSGYFAPTTIPVFRSEAARYVLFIQMSKEMWDFDAEGTGDILFSRVINGFLPELFKRWANIDAKHLVTIVLFTRVEYDMPTEKGMEHLKSLSDSNHFPTRDFYRVVVNDIASGHWTAILDELKRNFRTFLRDVSIQKFSGTADSTNEGQPLAISGRPTAAIRGNILEAIHLATSHLSYEHIDRDMSRTGHSIVVITPGSGLFEVSYESLAATTDAVTSIGIAIDLVSLSPMPLHSVPLFKYRNPHGKLNGLRTTGARGMGSLDTRSSNSSFAGKSPPFSLKTTQISAFARPMSRDTPPPHSKQWNYGIPHWLDISFWNPATYKEDRRITKNDMNAPIPFTVNKKSRSFVPRVRLYEIQMMGVMESEQSNISIPYLSEKNFGFQRTDTTISDVSSKALLPHADNNSLSPVSSYKAQLSDSLRPEGFLSSFTNHRNMMISSPATQQKKGSNWMDEYDDNVFVPFPRKRYVRKSAKAKRLMESENTGSRAQDRFSTRSISSSKGHEEHELERTVSGQSIPRTKEIKSSSKHTNSTQDHPPIKSAIKSGRTPRISRSISFALRGLGIAPPRAQPSTEINVEHAQGRATPARTPTTTDPIVDFESPKRPSTSTTDESSSVRSIPQSPHLSPTPTKSVESVEIAQPRPILQPRPISQSRPISIKSMKKRLLSDSGTDRNGGETTMPTAVERPTTASIHGATQGPFPMTRNYKKHEPVGARDAPTVSSSPGRTLAPWVRSINPSNAPKVSLRDASWFGRWQHAYPRPPNVAVVKWKSLKTPAILPLTTEEFPSSKELAANYLQTPYRVFPNEDHDGNDMPRAQETILREMVALRLSHGFQIVIGGAVAEATGQPFLEFLNVFDTKCLGKDDTTIILSKGNIIHRLSCVAGGEIEVTRFTRLSGISDVDKSDSPTYTLAIRTILAKTYDLSDVKLISSAEEYNWNYADNYIAGHRDHLIDPTRQLRFWRIRFVLIPMHLPPNARRHIQPFSEDNEEEIHLLGISQLTSLWQRNKYIPPDEKRFQSSGRKQKDQNPLNILYQTQDPSEIVGAEFNRLLLTDPQLDNPPAQLLPDSELLERSDFGPSSLMELAHIIQGEKGVRLMDRRWHLRLHYSCLIGSEFTTWLVQTFRDIDSRDEAVKFGNELMKLGLFIHVERRHNFRDGNYFYQIASQYRIPRPESKSGWFPGLSSKSDNSVPATPVNDAIKESPNIERVRSESSETLTSMMETPSKTKNKVTIMLSKTMKYDVDPRKRSSRPEVIDLHYDRIHNPENCFHIELSWMSATAKLVEDAVASWGSTAEKYGLKLVQVPIAEAAATVKVQTFRKFYRVKLSVVPPSPPVSLPFGATSFSQQGKPDRHFFQKAILRKFDFVLDFESASSFPPDVEVYYSWGKPDYQYPQYIHRSGCLLAQISDEGDLIFLANRLFSTKSAAGRDTSHHKFDRSERSDFHRARANTYTYDPMFSPRLSPIIRPIAGGVGGSGGVGGIGDSLPPIHNIPALTLNSSPTSSLDAANLYKTPEQLKTQVEEFCNDPIRLQHFYTEEQHVIRPVSTRMGPTTVLPPPSASTSSSAMDASIPSLELPASLVGPHIPPPAADSEIEGSKSLVGMSSAEQHSRPVSSSVGEEKEEGSQADNRSPSVKSGGLNPVK
ncbi:Dishevelled, Egl-10, and Pleckstrin domain protein [Talaromyces proteolyticus]|uniref:Vacuolar membrane-associated protein IML1 n=1 Tax=Talaromyces proteolyticus TaxID=1131652 RepID=A0AAD4PZP9_9EURO|nr:Dishevelled, Egl-10, and Pleckstrin domain protein [Talaromyces proteolyticus]KAH8696113.1 Dishevelled, Egl-10, and Pleckstrin domain protein [Talaromyces proteolyticus]